jgi:hypothetical protein
VPTSGGGVLISAYPKDNVPSTSTSSQEVAKIKFDEDISENQAENKTKPEEEQKGEKRRID